MFCPLGMLSKHVLKSCSSLSFDSNHHQSIQICISLKCFMVQMVGILPWHICSHQQCSSFIAPGGELQLRHVIVLRGVSWHVLYLPIKLPIFALAPYFQQSIFPVLSILIYFMMIPRSFHFLNSSQGASAI